MAGEDLVFIDGAYTAKATATLPLFDHGYLYGDAVFEGVRAYNGRVFRLDEHLKRLFFSAHALGFRVETLTVDDVRNTVLELCRRNDHANGYIRVTMSRGTGLGLDPAHIEQRPRLIISTQELRLYGSDLYDNGLTMVTCATRVPSADVIDPRIKGTGKYINNILAKMEANRLGAGEGLMLNAQGHVAEATGDNIFVVIDGKIVTPPTSAGCLKGITRQVAMELAEKQLGLPVREENLTLYDVYNAEEAFLTGTAAEIIPAVSLDQRPIGNGKPGDLTRRLIGAFRAHTAESGTTL
jgi:branched-chain amino acid aminotransferase